jgi:hypothetical protein
MGWSVIDPEHKEYLFYLNEGKSNVGRSGGWRSWPAQLDLEEAAASARFKHPLNQAGVPASGTAPSNILLKR